MKNYVGKKRIEVYNFLETIIFGANHTKNDVVDSTFDFMNEFLDKHYFTEKPFKWNREKCEEEFNEIYECLDQLRSEFSKFGKVRKSSILHITEEISDFMVATAGTISRIKDTNQTAEFEGRYEFWIVHIVNIIEWLKQLDIAISVDDVFLASRNKLSQYMSALRTYEELLADNFEESSELVSIIRRLHTQEEIIKNKDKIVKEIRRIRYGLVNYQR